MSVSQTSASTLMVADCEREPVKLACGHSVVQWREGVFNPSNGTALAERQRLSV